MPDVTIPREEYDRLRRVAAEARVVVDDVEDWRSTDDENPVPWPYVALHGGLLRAALEGRPRPDLDAPKYQVPGADVTG